jgi:hypothetical protein
MRRNLWDAQEVKQEKESDFSLGELLHLIRFVTMNKGLNHNAAGSTPSGFGNGGPEKIS